MKYLENWPVRVGLSIKLGLSKLQESFLKRHGTVGNYCWVIIRISDELFLIPWYHLDKELTVQTIYEYSKWHGKRFSAAMFAYL